MAGRRALPHDSWHHFGTKVLIGRALHGQKKLDEVERHLVEGYEGMKERCDSIPPDNRGVLTGTLERLVEFYDSRGEADDAEKAAGYRTELEHGNPKAGGAGAKSPGKE